MFRSLHRLLKSLCFSSLECSDYIHAVGLRRTLLSERVVHCHGAEFEGKICQDNSLYSVSQAHIMEKELLVQTHDFSISKIFVGP